jgi:hypothetical protein
MTTEYEQMLITKYDLMFESRLARVETAQENTAQNLISAEKNLMDAIKEIKSDLRWMFGIMLGFSGILLGLMAKGFHWFL